MSKARRTTELQIAENCIKIYILKQKFDPKLSIDITLLEIENERIISKFLKGQNPD